MSDGLINLQNEVPPPREYPRGRFVALLAVVFLLVTLIGIAQREHRGTTKGSSFSDSTMQGDLSLKLSYAYESWAAYFPGSGQEAQIESFQRTQRDSAIVWYQQSVQDDPSPGNLRRLIIAEHSGGRGHAIDSLASLGKHNNRLAAEAAMWRSVYYSHLHLTPHTVRDYESRIHSLGLGWHEHLALADLFHRAGKMSQAKSELAKASASASRTMVRFMAFLFVMLALGITGAGLLIWYVSFRRANQPVDVDSEDDTASARSFVAGYLLEAFVVYLTITVGVQVIAGLVFPQARMDEPRFAVTLTTFVYILTGTLSLLFLAHRIRSAGLSWRTIGFASRNPMADIRWGIGGYAACLPLVVVGGLISRLIGRYVQTPSNPIIPLFVESTTVLERVALFALAAVAAPFFEELFFRGSLFHSFRARYGIRAGIILSAVIFALVHPFPFDFVPILALGSVFATLVHHRGSLLPSMVAHALNNTASFIMLLILTGS